jgi:hypothetical protein
LESAFAGVLAGVGVVVGDAATCELDEELLPPQAANPATRPATARTIAALLLKLDQAVSDITAPF